MNNDPNSLMHLRTLTDARVDADTAWRDEIRRLSATHSVRLIAKHAGVSHNAVWKIARQS